MSHRMYRVALLAVCALSTVPLANGVGCGEPSTSDTPSSACTDWQCSRRVQVPSSGDNTTYYCVRGLGRGTGPCTSDADCYRALACNRTSSTCVATATTMNTGIGFVGVAVAVLLFGSNYIPVRKMRTGNGVFFQFAMSIGILVVGIAVQLIRQTNAIYPASMLGGLMWSIGNCASVRVINAIGIGLAVTTWGCSSMLVGWAAGRFGVWGIKQEVPSSEVYSILGVVTGVVAIALFGMVKPGSATNAANGDGINVSDEKDALLLETPASDTGAAALSPSKRAGGFVLALVCGVFFGFFFDASQAMMDDYATRSLSEDIKYSPNGLDYAFSAVLGVYLTSVAYFIAVLLLQKKFPAIADPPDTTPALDMFVPAFVSGMMWAGATVAWFVANTNLGMAVSYPLIALGPCVVASMWGILYLKELHGIRNFLLLIVAFGVVAVSCVFTVLSKSNAS